MARVITLRADYRNFNDAYDKGYASEKEKGENKSRCRNLTLPQQT